MILKEAKEYANELMVVYECKDKALYHLACMLDLLQPTIQGMVCKDFVKLTIKEIENWQQIELK